MMVFFSEKAGRTDPVVANHTHMRRSSHHSVDTIVPVDTLGLVLLLPITVL